MKNAMCSRRALLAHGLKLPLGGFLLAATAAHAADKACVDMERLDEGQKSIRESLKYTDTAPDPKTTCATCGFFEPTSAGCGNCMIFSGPVAATAHCESWSAKG